MSDPSGENFGSPSTLTVLVSRRATPPLFGTTQMSLAYAKATWSRLTVGLRRSRVPCAPAAAITQNRLPFIRICSLEKWRRQRNGDDENSTSVRTRTAKRLAGFGARVLAVVDRDYSVHEHPLDARRELHGLLVRRAILN